jgi:hypothetical protein
MVDVEGSAIEAGAVSIGAVGETFSSIAGFSTAATGCAAKFSGVHSPVV